MSTLWHIFDNGLIIFCFRRIRQVLLRPQHNRLVIPITLGKLFHILSHLVEYTLTFFTLDFLKLLYGFVVVCFACDDVSSWCLRFSSLRAASIAISFFA